MNSGVYATRRNDSKDNSSRECRRKRKVNDFEVPIEEPERESKQGRALKEEGCGQEVGSGNFMTSDVEPFQKITQGLGVVTRVGE